MDAFKESMDLLQKGVSAFGTLLVLWGLISFGVAFKDKNGPGQGAAIAEIVGGAIIVAGALFFSRVAL